jgi:hypothetical protein
LQQPVQTGAARDSLTKARKYEKRQQNWLKSALKNPLHRWMSREAFGSLDEQARRR